MKFIYLASPYTHSDPGVMLLRFDQACKAAAHLMLQGHAIFAPIAHSHPISLNMKGKQTDFEFWMVQDLPVLKAAQELWVLQLPGWMSSRGVNREIDFATEHDIPVKYIAPFEVGIL